MKNMEWMPLKRFDLEGVIHDDAHIWRLKEEYITLLGIQMRNSGYVPRLDIPAQFSIEYNRKSNSYSFQLLVYGVYVGERDCEWIFGIDEEGPIPMPQSKSKESCSEAA